jgi:tetratricopeptide (TPR) repeat protein
MRSITGTVCPAVALALTLCASGLALAQDASDPVSLVQQGRRLNAAGQQTEALQLYERALLANPDLFDAHLAAGISLDLLGRYVDARTHLLRAIALAPEDARTAALNAMAVSFAFERMAAQAAPFYQRVFDAAVAAGRSADGAEAANALGRLYLETGDLDNARRWYETGYREAKRQADEPASQLALWEFRWLHAQARIAARAGRPDDARRQVDAARALVRSTTALSDQEPALAYLEGYVALYSKDPARAADALARADQKDPFVLMLEAMAKEAAGNQAAARTFWEQVLTLNGHSLQNALARPAARKALGQAAP